MATGPQEPSAFCFLFKILSTPSEIRFLPIHGHVYKTNHNRGRCTAQHLCACMLWNNMHFSNSPVLKPKWQCASPGTRERPSLPCPHLSNQPSWLPIPLALAAGIALLQWPGLSPADKWLWELLVNNSQDRPLPSAHSAASETAAGKGTASKTHLAPLPSMCQDAIQNLGTNGIGKHRNKAIYLYLFLSHISQMYICASKNRNLSKLPSKLHRDFSLESIFWCLLFILEDVGRKNGKPTRFHS